MRALLDVNVLIALLDQDHIFHETAMGWLETEIRHGWASCPITQNGCIRIMSNPGYPEAIPTVHVAKRLEEAVNDSAHEFWPDDISLVNSSFFNWSFVLGHRQVTDMYLLALAFNHGGRLVTFDRSIMIEAVSGADSRNLVVLT